jgi:sugar/nucleoside kinase (ribokinase family)
MGDVKKYDAVVAGYICIDLTPDFGKSKEASSISNLLKPGKLIEIGELSFTLGGAVANTGIALKRFNKRVYLN